MKSWLFSHKNVAYTDTKVKLQFVRFCKDPKLAQQLQDRFSSKDSKTTVLQAIIYAQEFIKTNFENQLPLKQKNNIVKGFSVRL